MRKLSLPFFAIFAISCIASVNAQEKLEMQGTEITGNKELPKVLYIVPWKSVERFDIKSPPITSIMDQELTRIDRASFKRQIHYHSSGVQPHVTVASSRPIGKLSITRAPTTSLGPRLLIVIEYTAPADPSAGGSPEPNASA